MHDHLMSLDELIGRLLVVEERDDDEQQPAGGGRLLLTGEESVGRQK
jgi:hypothetical protein